MVNMGLSPTQVALFPLFYVQLHKLMIHTIYWLISKSAFDIGGFFFLSLDIHTQYTIVLDYIYFCLFYFGFFFLSLNLCGISVNL